MHFRISPRFNFLESSDYKSGFQPHRKEEGKKERKKESRARGGEALTPKLPSARSRTPKRPAPSDSSAFFVGLISTLDMSPTRFEF